MHSVPDRAILTPALLRRFQAEGEFDGADGRHQAFIETQDGRILVHGHGLMVLPEQQMFGVDMIRLMNRALHHDGAWMVVFTHQRPPAVSLVAMAEYQRIVFIWVDKDGDVQFPLETDEDFSEVMGHGADHWLENAEAAWQIWKFSQAMIDPQEGETFKKALGERAPSSIN